MTSYATFQNAVQGSVKFKHGRPLNAYDKKYIHDGWLPKPLKAQDLGLMPSLFCIISFNLAWLQSAIKSIGTLREEMSLWNVNRIWLPPTSS